jgi:poly(3-hydroxybutyrate) depolymerase
LVGALNSQDYGQRIGVFRGIALWWATAMVAKLPALALPIRRDALKAALSFALFAMLITVGCMAHAEAAEPREETEFGSNPGNLRMFSYVPESINPAAPLIVVLHGCKQKAPTFASDAGWLALADRTKVLLLLPEQKGLPSFL